MSSFTMTQSRASFALLAIDTNPATSLNDATTGVKRHADYGTGADLAPGGAL
ncbi:MAG TPA: hypothetical protein VFK68_13225 [Propionibacteriaceae bacterium]|nr:hypothetical protein [Propionibacteriaceae bacterium]